MPEYAHLLAAVEADDDGRCVLTKAHDLAERFGATLSILHVVDYLPVDMAEGMLAQPIDFSAERSTMARKRLLPWCEALGIPPERLEVVIGAISREIVRIATERKVDLIVIGHRQHRGLAALFSHTDEGVLARAGCDVLAVTLPEPVKK